MPKDTLFWIYCANGALLLVHELDSVYLKEWDLFRMKGGIHLFLILHIHICFAVLAGAALLVQGRFEGHILSLILAAGGLAAPVIHGAFIRKGHPEFRTPLSISILAGTGLLSLVQVLLTLRRMAG